MAASGRPGQAGDPREAPASMPCWDPAAWAAWEWAACSARGTSWLGLAAKDRRRNPAPSQTRSQISRSKVSRACAPGGPSSFATFRNQGLRAVRRQVRDPLVRSLKVRRRLQVLLGRGVRSLQVRSQRLRRLPVQSLPVRDPPLRTLRVQNLPLRTLRPRDRLSLGARNQRKRKKTTEIIGPGRGRVQSTAPGSVNIPCWVPAAAAWAWAAWAACSAAETSTRSRLARSG